MENNSLIPFSKPFQVSLVKPIHYSMYKPDDNYVMQFDTEYLKKPGLYLVKDISKRILDEFSNEKRNFGLTLDSWIQEYEQDIENSNFIVFINDQEKCKLPFVLEKNVRDYWAYMTDIKKTDNKNYMSYIKRLSLNFQYSIPGGNNGS